MSLFQDPKTRPWDRLRTRYVLIGICIGLFLGVVFVNSAYGYSLYEGELKSPGYVFKVDPACGSEVKEYLDHAINKYGRFTPLSVDGITNAKKGFDGINAFVCVTALASGLNNAEIFGVDCVYTDKIIECSQNFTEGSSNTVSGRATYWFEIATKLLVECDIEIVQTAPQLKSVVLHEVGHCLGLGHSDWFSAIMYPYTRYSVPPLIYYDDVEGLCHLYGCADPVPDETGCIFIPRISRLGELDSWSGVVCNLRLPVEPKKLN